YVEMPVFAGCLDVGWELTWSFFQQSDMGMLIQGANYVWFAMDAGFIFSVGVLIHGSKQLTIPHLQRRSVFIPACLFVAAFSALVSYQMRAQGLDNGIGSRSAYLIQLCISFLYLMLMLRQPDLRNFSYTANWCRSLGSALVVVFFYMKWPEDRFLCTIGTVAAMVDATFLTVFAMRRRQLAAAAEPVTAPGWQAPLAQQPGPASSALP
ncbi:MAG TPA: hypothetical protein VF179_23630, partial [Thermoanaerobaculia bacterium]|nr:hypothetical protein [Thermoanaerobaculia bacterium]